MKPYTFETLQTKAGEIFSDLIQQGEIEIRTRNPGIDQAEQGVTKEEVDGSIKDVVTASWGLAEAFLDHGHAKFADKSDSGAKKAPVKTKTPSVKIPKKD